MSKKDNPHSTLYSDDEKYEDALFTPWSFVHYMSGCAMKGLGVSFVNTFAIHLLYEAKDRDEHERGEVYNSMINSIGDQGCCMAGWYLTPAKYDPKWVFWFLASWAFASSMKDTIG